MNFLNIPSHNCHNCGACCGPVPISKDECKTIQAYVDKNKPKYEKYISNLGCKFRVDNNCSIYEVRPLLCRLFGVVKGMDCIYGNTNHLDGYKFFDFNKGIHGLLNFVINTNY